MINMKKQKVDWDKQSVCKKCKLIHSKSEIDFWSGYCYECF